MVIEMKVEGHEAQEHTLGRSFILSYWLQPIPEIFGT